MTPTPTEVEELAEEVRLAKLLAYTDTATWILTRFVRREERQHHFDLLLEDNARLRAELRGQRCDGSGWMRRVVPADIHGRAPCNEGEGCPACKPAATPKGDGGATIGYGWHMNYGDGSRDREVVSEAGERDCNATPAGEDQSPAFRPDAPVRGCPRHTPYWCYPCDDCSEILRRKHEAEAAAPVHVSLTPERMSLLEHHCSEADFATIGKPRDESYAAGYQAGRDDAVRLNVKQVSHVVELGSETLRAVVALAFALRGEELTPAHSIPCADALLTRLREKETR